MLTSHTTEVSFKMKDHFFLLSQSGFHWRTYLCGQQVSVVDKCTAYIL